MRAYCRVDKCVELRNLFGNKWESDRSAARSIQFETAIPPVGGWSVDPKGLLIRSTHGIRALDASMTRNGFNMERSPDR